MTSTTLDTPTLTLSVEQPAATLTARGHITALVVNEPVPAGTRVAIHAAARHTMAHPEVFRGHHINHKAPGRPDSYWAMYSPPYFDLFESGEITLDLDAIVGSATVAEVLPLVDSPVDGPHALITTTGLELVRPDAGVVIETFDANSVFGTLTGARFVVLLTDAEWFRTPPAGDPPGSTVKVL